MFNKRSFVLGLGVGIIIGALLLQLFMIGQNSMNNLKEIEQQQRQEGLEENQFPAEEPSPAPTATPDRTEAPTPTTTPAASEVESETSDEQAAVETEKTEVVAPVQKLIRIEPGFSLSETSELLLANGIIDDAAAFVKQMKAKNKPVRAGYFLIHENAGIDEAIAGVTGQPITEAEAEEWMARQ